MYKASRFHKRLAYIAIASQFLLFVFAGWFLDTYHPNWLCSNVGLINASDWDGDTKLYYLAIEEVVPCNQRKDVRFLSGPAVAHRDFPISDSLVFESFAYKVEEPYFQFDSTALWDSLPKAWDCYFFGNEQFLRYDDAYTVSRYYYPPEEVGFEVIYFFKRNADNIFLDPKTIYYEFSKPIFSAGRKNGYIGGCMYLCDKSGGSVLYERYFLRYHQKNGKWKLVDKVSWPELDLYEDFHCES